VFGDARRDAAGGATLALVIIQTLNAQAKTEPSEFRSFLRTLARRKLVIALCIVVAAGSALAYSLAQEDQYSASATLLFRAPGFDQTVFGAQVFQTQDPTREAATNLDLVTLSSVADRTANRLDNGLTGSEIASKISASPQGQSDLVTVTATDPDPVLASRIANAFVQSFVAFRRDADRNKIADAKKLVRRNYQALSPAKQAGSEGQGLQRQLGQLSKLEALQTGNAEVVQKAGVPTAPSSPRPARNTVLAGALGLLLGLALAFLLDRLDRRIRDPEELEDAFEMPMLGLIPESKTLQRSEDGGEPLPPLTFTEAEAFRMLRTRLRYFNVDREVRSVLVTSASPRDGKSTVAWYLAFNAASSGVRTILLEADFHQPTIAEKRGVEPLPGLAEVLTHQGALASGIQHVPVTSRSNGESGERALDVVVAGATPPNPAELLESHEMATLLSSLTDEYDLVVIDTPPIQVLADAIPLMKLVGGVLIVGQLGKTTRDEASQLRQQLQQLDAPVLGFVANRTGRRRGYGYGYYNYHGYYGEGNGRRGATRGIKIGRRT
jgi:capsular exopolysaccharide synthesis family protein